MTVAKSQSKSGDSDEKAASDFVRCLIRACLLFMIQCNPALTNHDCFAKHFANPCMLIQ